MHGFITRNTDGPDRRWPNITVPQHWISVSCLLGYASAGQSSFNFDSRCRVNMFHLNNIGSSVGTHVYYYHATPGEPLQGSPGLTW